MTEKILTISLTPKRKKFLQALVCVWVVAAEAGLLCYVIVSLKDDLPILRETWGVAGVTAACLILVFLQGVILFYAHREFRESGVRFEVTGQHIRKIYPNGRIEERNWSDLFGIYFYKPPAMAFRNAKPLILGYGYTRRAFSYEDLLKTFEIAKLDPLEYGLGGKWSCFFYLNPFNPFRRQVIARIRAKN